MTDDNMLCVVTLPKTSFLLFYLIYGGKIP
jgi:hypothetical protein